MSLDKFDWAQIIDQLSACCYTEGGQQRATQLTPQLDADEILRVWEQTTALRDLVARGYALPPIELPAMTRVFKAAAYGQVLDPCALLDVLKLLNAVCKWYVFCKNLAQECRVLQRFRAALLTLPRLVKQIEKTIDADASLRDTASAELKSIRIQQKSLQDRIETKLRRLIYQHKFDPYLQDDFITVRNGKYVIPLRVDANGRVKGNAIDFSRSRETMFFEPQEIEKSNQLLQTLEFSENLTCYRILQELSSAVTAEYDTLHANYEELLALDLLHARAQLAHKLNAHAITLSSKPSLCLQDMFHPLLASKMRVKNTLQLDSHNTLIISGVNAGGKTVMLKTVGLLQIMARAGLMVTAAPSSEMYIFNNLRVVMDEEQNITHSLSAFSSHLLSLQRILAEAGTGDLVLIDEIATGTDPDTGAALAQAALEQLAAHRITTLVTTHHTALKELAHRDVRFRNASMQFSTADLRPTYRLLLDRPGQSYGLEIARSLGLPAPLLARAATLRSDNTQKFEAALLQLEEEKQELQAEKNKFHLETLKLQKYHDQWQRDAHAIAGLPAELQREIDALPPRPSVEGLSTAQLRQRLQPTATPTLPGKELDFTAAEVGLRVYCLPLKKSAHIIQLGRNAKDFLEISIGDFRTKVKLRDLRLL